MDRFLTPGKYLQRGCSEEKFILRIFFRVPNNDGTYGSIETRNEFYTWIHTSVSNTPLRWVHTCKYSCAEENGFVTATKLGTTNKFFVAATKNFAAATKRFVDRNKNFVVVTKYFCYPYFKK